MQFLLWPAEQTELTRRALGFMLMEGEKTKQ